MDLYREELLDHYQNPRNFGRLEKPTKSIHESNPLCGDVIDMDIIVADGFVKDISFVAKGCAVSIAAASMFTEKIKGMKVEDVKKITKDDVLNMINPNLTLSRIKCALLVYNTFMKA